VFFNEVTARFDYAVAGLVASAVTRRGWWLLAGVPYLRHVRNHARQWPRRDQLAFMAGGPIVDAVTFAALLAGSLSWRSVVL
jgi:hypothetical protein